MVQLGVGAGPDAGLAPHAVSGTRVHDDCILYAQGDETPSGSLRRHQRTGETPVAAAAAVMAVADVEGHPGTEIGTEPGACTVTHNCLTVSETGGAGSTTSGTTSGAGIGPTPCDDLGGDDRNRSTGSAPATSPWVACDPAVDAYDSRRHPAVYDTLKRRVRRPTQSAGGAVPFASYPSIKEMSEGRPSIVIGHDTESVTIPEALGRPGIKSREILSWQFSTIDPADDRWRIEIVMFGREVGRRISLETALQHVIRLAGLAHHKLAPQGWAPGGGVPRTLGERNGVYSAGNFFRPNKVAGRAHSLALPITLVAHYMKADLTAFADARLTTGTPRTTHPGIKTRQAMWLTSREPDILRAIVGAAGGLVSVSPVRMVLPSPARRRVYPIELTIRDTMAHAPAGQSKLSDLGRVVGVPKLSLPPGTIEHMDTFLLNDRDGFLDYAAVDAPIALEYVSATYGDDQAIPLSTSTAAARAVRGTIMRREGLASTKDFHLLFGGLTSVTRTREATVSTENQLDYYRERELQPVDVSAARWLHGCASSYRGGYNGCSEIGYFGRELHDLDLEGCYPTAESMVLDVDYLHPDGVIERTLHNEEMTLAMFAEHGALTPFYGFVRFEFPASVEYPSIAIPMDGGLFFTQTSGHGRGVFAAGPEVWLALTLGARVHCQVGDFGRVRKDEGGRLSRMLLGANRQLVVDREAAKAQFGTKSVQQGLLKLLAVGAYGKVAQAVAGQKGWNAWAQERDAIGGSAITSPYHAMMTTALARCVLIAVQNQLHALGYSTPSVTTDGFLTDAPLNVVEGLDLYGLAEPWQAAREALCGDRTMWARKHHQTDLLNVSTRTNVSRQATGVLAHGGYKTPRNIAKDSQEDRDHFYSELVSRDKAILVELVVPPSVEELTRTRDRLDFGMVPVTREMAMEFDRKRRPVAASMTHDVLTVDGLGHEVAHVHTRPWYSPEEAALGRRVDSGLRHWDRDLDEIVWDHSPVRKTEGQWLDYFANLDRLVNLQAMTSQAQQLDRIAKSIVIAQRQGIVDIPWLGAGGNGDLSWRLDLLSMFGLPRVSDRFWHHALSNSERQGGGGPRRDRSLCGAHGRMRRRPPPHAR